MTLREEVAMTEPLSALARPLPRAISLISGLGMMVFSALTIDHFFAANYPDTIWAGSFCDINAFFNCDSSAFSPVAQVFGVPIGVFGFLVGVLVVHGALVPSARLERTNKTIALANVGGIVGLLVFSLAYHRSLCLLCSGYYAFSLLGAAVFWRDRAVPWLRPSTAVLLIAGAVTGLGAYGVHAYHDTKRDAQSGGTATRIVRQYYSLEPVAPPSVISPYWTIRATDRFEDAPIRIVAYEDLLCPDCKLLSEQLARLEQEFEGQINVAFQFFPLEAACNGVVSKDLHPGACEVAYLAAYDPSKFRAIHDEVFANIRAARDPEWRQALAGRHGVENALTDQETRDLVHRILQTGAEYERTSDRYEHGIRSTPTLIINDRMVIGTLPYEQLRALFQALVDESQGDAGFLEHWVPAAERAREAGPSGG
jgi:uncharacterized membrane protein/protein-disulfide isomerase